jgi:hypothetical protein
MKKLRISQLVKMKSVDLVKLIENWHKYDPRIVLIANSELKKRDYKTSYSLEKNQNEFSSKFNHTDINEFLAKYLEKDNYTIFFQKGIDGVTKTTKPSNMKKITFTIIGAVLGLPLSYYFQPDMVQAKVGGIGGYIKNFGDVLEAKDLISNVIMGVIVFAIIGYVVGYFMDKNEAQKTN